MGDKCECCGVREADKTLSTKWAGAVHVSMFCIGELYDQRGSLGPSEAGRILKQRVFTQRALARDTIPAPPPTEPVHTVFAREIKAEFVDEPAAPTCRECGRPAKYDAYADATEYCAYCQHRVHSSDDAVQRMRMDEDEVNVQARAERAAWERRNRPRVTKDAIELAKPHPWQCGGEDEP